MKYDCTKAKDFLHELKRMSVCCKKKLLFECEVAEVRSKEDIYCVSLASNISTVPEEMFDEFIELVQEWSDSHPERRELTEDETNILKAFKVLGFTYIAAEENGCVCAYIRKPQKGIEVWHNGVGDYGVSIGMSTAVCKTKNFFGGIVSWKDEEPAEIEELLKSYD